MSDPYRKDPNRVKRRRPTTLQRSIVKQAPLPPTPELYREPFTEIPVQIKIMQEQLEQLQSTLENIQKLINSLNLKENSSTDWMKNLHSLDYKQMMSLLQSPAIQSLVETFAKDESSPLK